MFQQQGDLSGPKYVDDLQTGITDRDCPKETFTYSITAVPRDVRYIYVYIHLFAFSVCNNKHIL